jgi:hypothetical protein
MYYHGKGDHTGRLIELLHLRSDLMYRGYHNLNLPHYEELVLEVEKEIEMLKNKDHSHV